MSVSLDHIFIKALNKAKVSFPTTRQDIIEKLGDITLSPSKTETLRAASLVEGIEPDYFDNGSAFFCAYHSALYQQTYRKAFLQAKYPDGAPSSFRGA